MARARSRFPNLPGRREKCVIGLSWDAESSGFRGGRSVGNVASRMKITKALITAAAPNQRTLPLQTLVDRTGVPRTALAIIVEEALAAGIEKIGVMRSGVRGQRAFPAVGRRSCVRELHRGGVCASVGGGGLT